MWSAPSGNVIVVGVAPDQCTVSVAPSAKQRPQHVGVAGVAAEGVRLDEVAQGDAVGGEVGGLGAHRVTLGR